MTIPNPPFTGGCRCDRVRFRVTRSPLITAACRCTGCQRMTASTFSTTVMFPQDALEIIEGAPVIGGLHDPELRHYHCEWCKSWLFTRPPSAYGVVNVRATMLDDTAWFAPFMETYTDEKLPWATTGAPHSFAKLPENEQFPMLIEAFAQANG